MLRRAFPVLLFLYAVALYFFLLEHVDGFGVDWRNTYYPAVRLLLNGDNPYTVTTLHNPVWALIPLMPFAVLGEAIGGAVLYFVTFTVYVGVAHKLKASRLALALFMASPLIVYNLVLGNIDWLVALGFILPPQVGLFLVVLKPQIGIAVALYWAWRAYRSGGVGQVVRTFWPVALCLAASFAMYGNWLAGRSDDVLSAGWNLSFFPWTLPVGAALLISSRGHAARAISASPFLSPYLSLGSWSIAQLGLVGNTLHCFVTTVALWVAYLFMLWRFG